MKYTLVLIALLALAIPAVAQQANVTFAWDASADDDRNPASTNPIKYKLWKCTDAALTGCGVSIDVGILLEGSIQLAANTTSWIYVTAYRFAVDGQPNAGTVESAKSNVLRVQVFSPPGNPGNIHVKTVVVSQ